MQKCPFKTVILDLGRTILRSFQIIFKFIMSQKLIKMDERKKDPARVLFTVLLSTRY